MKNLKQFFQPNFFTLLTVAVAFFAFGPLAIKTQKSVSVAVDKMNVFYIGVDNPITVAVEGIDDEKVKVYSDQVKLEKVGIGKYMVKAFKPGDAKILVHGEGFEPQELQFRVRRIPDPLASLQMENGTKFLDGELSAEDFKKATGLGVLMENFTFDFKADITSYTIVRVPKRGEQSSMDYAADNGDFDNDVKALMESAEPGDRFYFTNVKGKFPGRENPWSLNSLVFRIK